MFKKPVKVSAQNQLSGKDRKTMKNKLAETFDQACVDKILNLNDKIISCKITGSKMIIYNGNDYPLFVDGTGKNDYFPSLYTAIAFEPLIKVVDINEGVESYIYNGANLMWPGVNNYQNLGNFQKDQVVGIRTAKGDLVAIGALGCSLKELQSNADNSGVAVYILHYFNDKLWETGPKTKPQVLVKAEKPKPKQQKKQQQKKQQPKKQQVAEKKQKNKEQKKQQVQQSKQTKGKGKGKKKAKQSSDEQQQKVKPKQKQQDGKGKDKKKDKDLQKQTKQVQKQKAKPKGKNKKQSSQQKQKNKKQQSQKQQSDGQDDFANLVHSKHQKPTHTQPIKIEKKNQSHKVFSDQQDDKKGKKKPAKKQTKKKGGKKQSDQQEGQEGQQKVQQQKSVVSTKLMDQQFRQAFLNTLKLSKVQGQLPIDSGRFFMDFMLLARPPGVKLQIKDTSYKKLGKFYEEMGKLKFIQFKHNKDKKGQQGSSITKICWDNQQLKNYQPTIMKMNQKDVEEKQQVTDSKKKLRLTQTLQIQTAYKLHPNFKNALFAKKVNYAPTQQQQKQMKKQQQQLKNQPEYYSEQQVRALIQKYINQKLVPKKDKDKKQDKQKKPVDKMITIDYKNIQYLAELLKRQIEEYQENAEKEEDSGDQQQGKKNKKKRQNVMKMDRGALVNRILKTCSSSYHMKDKQSNFQAFYQGTFKGIQLVAQKSNNKNITKIIGLQTFIVPKSEAEQQINGFANLLKEKFACSVNIQNLPGKNAGKEIIAHGNFINELEQMFTQEYKINQDYITSQNKLDKKKKR